MTTLIVQCPNAACGRVSHLGIDPLGRIFRCPRCLTKLAKCTGGSRRFGMDGCVRSSTPEPGQLEFRSMPAWTMGWRCSSRPH